MEQPPVRSACVPSIGPAQGDENGMQWGHAWSCIGSQATSILVVGQGMAPNASADANTAAVGPCQQKSLRMSDTAQRLLCEQRCTAAAQGNEQIGCSI